MVKRGSRLSLMGAGRREWVRWYETAEAPFDVDEVTVSGRAPAAGEWRVGGRRRGLMTGRSVNPTDPRYDLRAASPATIQQEQRVSAPREELKSTVGWGVMGASVELDG